MRRPRILVTNDDGINAPGIKALVDIAKQYGDPFVVAPDSPTNQVKVMQLLLQNLCF